MAKVKKRKDKRKSNVGYQTTTFPVYCFTFIVFFVSCALILSGCAANRQYEAVEQICATGVAKATVMNTVEEVLSKMYFVVDKADSQQGFIRSRPLRGAQFFEFWRCDNVGGFNTTEANIQSIRRVAQLHINEQEGAVCISCDVKTQRLELPERQTSSSSEAYMMFSRSSRTMQRLRLSHKQKKGMAWVDLGEDPKLATKILRRLKKEITNLQKENML